MVCFLDVRAVQGDTRKVVVGGTASGGGRESWQGGASTNTHSSWGMAYLKFLPHPSKQSFLGYLG